MPRKTKRKRVTLTPILDIGFNEAKDMLRRNPFRKRLDKPIKAGELKPSIGLKVVIKF